MNEIQLSEHDARAILYCALGDMPDTEMNKLMDNLRDANFIKRTKAEEAEEAYKNIMMQFNTSSEDNCWNQHYIRKHIETIYAGFQELKHLLRLQEAYEKMKPSTSKIFDKRDEAVAGSLSNEETGWY